MRANTSQNYEADALLAARREAAMRDDVLAIVAHDLRSLLNVIVLAASALPDDDAVDVLAVRRIAKRSMLSAADRMERLLTDLVDAARLDADPVPTDTRPVAIAGLLEECAETFRGRAQAEGIQLEVRVEPGANVRLEVDPNRLHQALGNLVDNALKFTPKGGTVLLSAENTREGVQLSVTDTGCGISEEALPHVFDRFWQARRARRAGAGLGLFIALRIIEGHGGRIWAESQVGAGSVFRILLPRTGHAVPIRALTGAPAIGQEVRSEIAQGVRSEIAQGVRREIGHEFGKEVGRES